MIPESKWKDVFLQDLCVNEFWQVSVWYQVKSSEEAVILCKTSIGSLKLEINDLPATKVPELSLNCCFCCDCSICCQIDFRRKCYSLSCSSRYSSVIILCLFSLNRLQVIEFIVTLCWCICLSSLCCRYVSRKSLKRWRRCWITCPAWRLSTAVSMTSPASTIASLATTPPTTRMLCATSAV